jgi:hypothetical protein
MEVAGMNKKNGSNLLVPIQTPLLLTDAWSFLHFSRYLCYPMLKFMYEYLNGSIYEIEETE